MISELTWRTTTHQIKEKRCLLDPVEPTGMGCMIWLGMCGSGLGTGMVIMHRLHRRTREGLVRARTACFAVAVGTAVRGTAEWRTATTTPLATGSTTDTAGSALFCPQVNREPAGGRRRSVAGVVVGFRGCVRRRTLRRSGLLKDKTWQGVFAKFGNDGVY